MGDARQRNLALLVAGAFFLENLDGTIVTTAAPAMASSLRVPATAIGLVITAYLLTLAVLIPVSGWLTQRFGARRVFLTAIVLFTGASAACAASQGLGQLVAFRVLQGAGAALLLPGTLAVITHAFPQRDERARAIGLWAGIGSVALPAGPLLGGALVQGVGWRAVFFINVPVVLAALVVAGRVVRESRDPRGRSLDVGGVVLGALALGATTFAFIEAGRAGLDAPVVAAAVAALALIGLLLAVERASASPMLPLALLRRPEFTSANAVAGAMNLGTLGLLFVMTLYLQRVQQRSALEAGVALVPLFLPLSVLAPLAGRATARFGSRLPMAAGLLVAGTGVALLLRIGPGSSYAALLPALLLWGIGMGLLTPAVVAAAIGAVPGDRAGLASAVNNTSRQAGGAIGIAAYGAVAGSAAGRAGFVSGLHTNVFLTVALWAAAIMVTLAFVERGG
jgi:DHA2 family methylenomycin A resistance protein-like MFS transporter